MADKPIPQPVHTHRCARCGTGIYFTVAKLWSTGYPSHLATTCDGVHYHRPIED